MPKKTELEKILSEAKEIVPELTKFFLEGMFHPTGFYRICMRDPPKPINKNNTLDRFEAKYIFPAEAALLDVIKYGCYGIIFRDLILPYILK